jgi:hypothetical protein
VAQLAASALGCVLSSYWLGLWSQLKAHPREGPLPSSLKWSLARFGSLLVIG